MRFFSTLICCALFFTIHAQHVVINEVVTDPVFNYSDSDYNKTDDQSNVSEIDEWIELLILDNGINLNSWTIELLDGTDVSGDLSSSGAFQTSKYISSSGGTFIDTDSGDFLILGNVKASGSMANAITIILKDDSGTIIDQVALSSTSSTAPLGNSTSALDESIARIPDGKDTDNDANDFIATIATPGTANSKRGKVVINELVTETIRDWSAADYSFRADSIGTFTDIDEWIELYILEDNLNLAGWEIQLSSTDNVTGNLSDTGAFQFSKYISNTDGSSFYETSKGDYLLLANVSGSQRQLLNTGNYVLKNAFGEEVDRVRLGFGEAPNGNSSSKSNESVARLPNGTDTDNHTEDFTETFATPGFRNLYGGIDRFRDQTLLLNSDSIILQILTDSLQNNFTISLWILPEAPILPQTLLRTIDGEVVLKLNADHTITSEVTGVSVTSADTVSTKYWNHVTLKKSSSDFHLFLNGKLAQNWSGSFVFTNDTLLVGPLKAKIEELQIWKTELSESQIRSQMRLTQSGEENALLHYYQFNGWQSMEPISGTDITYDSGYEFVESEAPLSYGNSLLFNVNSNDSYLVPSTVENHALELSFKDNLPNGEVIVSYLEEEANLKPSGFTYGDGVWVIDNYGTNTGLNATMLFEFPDDYLTTTDTTTYFLYKRKSNARGNWTEYKTAADTVILTEVDKQVQFSGIESFSQFIVASTVSPLPLGFIDFYLGENKRCIELYWEFSEEKEISKYRVLKGIKPVKMDEIGSTSAKYFTDSVSNQIVYYRIEAVNYSGRAISSKIITWQPEQIDSAPLVEIYPNPCLNKLMIKANDLTNIIILNTEGKVVRQVHYPKKDEQELDLSGINEGVYIIKAKSGRKWIYRKVVLLN